MYRVSESTIYVMSKDNPPAMTVRSGDIIVFETRDCFNNQITDGTEPIEGMDWEQVNPATGPVFIEGAQVNDTLKIRILDIEIAPWGIMAAIPGAGVLGGKVTTSQVKRIPIVDGMAIFSPDIKVSCSPMIGVIGVAPKGEGVPCGVPDVHGGNMDNNRIKQGATLYLPVFHEGALLAIGDVHAAMGDGEIMVTGIEISGEITVKVEVMEQVTITNPRLEDANYCYTIASHEDLETAIGIATEEMTQIVMAQLGLSFNEAGMLLSAAGDLQICQVVDPKRTVRFAMPKSILPSMF